MTQALSAIMTDAITASPLPLAIEIARPSALASAFAFIDKDMYRFNNLIALVAERLEKDGMSFSTLDIQKTGDVISARMGLFDNKDRETTLTLETEKYSKARSFTIKGEPSRPGEPYKSPYDFQGGCEIWQPSHYRRDPRDQFVYGEATYRHGFETLKLHEGLATHLAQKTLRGFIHDVDYDRYRANVREETPSHDVRARRYHFPTTTPDWTP